MNSLPKTVTGQRRDCDLNPGPSAPESSTLTSRLPSHPSSIPYHARNVADSWSSWTLTAEVATVEETGREREMGAHAPAMMIVRAN